MSRAADQGAGEIVGINWGSTNFRAYRLAADGRLLDEVSRPDGVTRLDRPGMAALVEALMAQWPGAAHVYASGMVGSNVGWCDAPHVRAAAGPAEVARAAVVTAMGRCRVHIVPGVWCQRAFDGGPDVMRGEEVELFGVNALQPGLDGLVALPGTHTKWVGFSAGRITDFFTSMTGEMFDRLTAAGLLASIVDGEAVDGPAFQEGVQAGRQRQLGLGTLLFGARARVMRGQLARSDAASYLRGLLIGSEIADALHIHPGLAQACVPLIGSGVVCRLYASALATVGVQTRFVDSREACIAGFLALHRERTAS